jgi:hypothetical protein
MIEVHRTWWVSTAAVGARSIPKLIEDPGLLAPDCPTTSRCRRAVGRWLGAHTGCMATLRSDAVTVGANDVALGDLLQQNGPGPKHRAARGQPELLGRSLAVVEVHLVRRE